MVQREGTTIENILYEIKFDKSVKSRSLRCYTWVDHPKSNEVLWIQSVLALTLRPRQLRSDHHDIPRPQMTWTGHPSHRAPLSVGSQQHTTYTTTSPFPARYGNFHSDEAQHSKLDPKVHTTLRRHFPSNAKIPDSEKRGKTPASAVFSHRSCSIAAKRSASTIVSWIDRTPR
jgi:hypothetical protein